MKRLFILCMCMMTYGLYAMHSEEAFLQANKLYEQQEYVKSIELYSKVKNPGFAVLYNTALAYAHTEQYVEAVVELLKAERCANFKQLTLLYQLLDQIDRKESTEEQSWIVSVEKFFKKCILSYSMFLAQISLLILILLLFGMVYARLYRQKKGAFVFVIFLVLFACGIWHYKMNYMKQQIGVILVDSSMLTGPENTFYVKDTMRKGAIAKIIQQHDDFYQVVRGKKIGWVASENVKLVS